MISDPLGSAEQTRQLVKKLRDGVIGHAPKSVRSLLRDGADALEASLARETTQRERVEEALAYLYREGAAPRVAEVCDDLLDPSGALLGRVRKRAALSDVRLAVEGEPE